LIPLRVALEDLDTMAPLECNALLPLTTFWTAAVAIVT
jgi:hypothetical protein